MSNLSLERLLFDPSDPTEGPLMGSYLLGSGGAVISETGTALDVNIASAGGLGVYAEDSAAAGGELGQSVLLVRQDTLAISTSDDGDFGQFKSSDLGELYVKDSGANALLATIDADTSAILLDTNAMVVDLAAIEVLLTSIDVDTSTIAGDTTSIDALLTAAVDALGRVTVNDSPNNAIANVALPVLTSATALPTLANRTRLLIQNNGTKSIFIGDSGVTLLNGIEVAKGATLILEAGPGLAFFAIADTSTQDVRIIELS